MEALPAAGSQPSGKTAENAGKPAVTTIQFVGFRLAEVDYAFEIRRIQEIILLRPITRVPQLPDWIEGLINLRGSVIPVVSLRRKFALPERPIDDETRIIVVNIGSRTVGVVVDGVSRVMKIQQDQIQPPPVTIEAIERAALQGVARLEERLIVILNVDKLLQSEHWVDPALASTPT